VANGLLLDFCHYLPGDSGAKGEMLVQQEMDRRPGSGGSGPTYFRFDATIRIELRRKGMLDYMNTVVYGEKP
jgi:hypothetical protein